MKRLSILTLVLFSFLFLQCQPGKKDGKEDNKKEKKIEYAIVIHGGAGNTQAENFPKEAREKYKEKLQEARDKGIEVLKNGGTAIETVEQVIHILENSPLFNSGKGAVFTHDGENELDASIMNGNNLNAGAVAGVKTIKNPISAAIEVMKNSEHVMLAGEGASEFAEKQGLEMVENSYFRTEKRWKSLQRQLEKEKNGTVGCVVLDKHGNLAAGTSTGGMTNKKYGRIGDSPIIGAGTYANNNTCAVSATGHGEYFIRYAVAHDISALMEYKNLSLNEAANMVINDKLVKAGGDGGVIAVDHNGNISMTFNTNMMFRAYAKSTGDKGVKIFKNE
jgi:beta-aspartyl-peptidase (threonine type)